MTVLTPMQRSLLAEADRLGRLVIRPSVHNRRKCAEALARRQLLRPAGWLLPNGRQVKAQSPSAIAQVFKVNRKESHDETL